MNAPPKLSLHKIGQIRKLKQKKYRKSSESFICEGFRLFDAALQSEKIQITNLLIHEDIIKSKNAQWALDKCFEKKISVFIIDKKSLKSLSDEMHSQGLLFTVKMQLSPASTLQSIDNRICVYLDRISDPGNLGTILRTAAWFGFNEIILSPECVDPFNEKSVRASAGAIFEVDIFTDIKFDWLDEHFRKIKNYQFIATGVSNSSALTNLKIAPKSIIFFGQEAAGLSRNIRDSADKLLSIPQIGNIESLNLAVACGIIMYEVSRQRSS